MGVIQTLAMINAMRGGSGGGGGGSGDDWIVGDGKTRLHISIVDDALMDVPLYFYQSVANGVAIDWGDGSPVETVETNGNVQKRHTYEKTGDFVIVLDVASGCTFRFGKFNCSVLGDSSGAYTAYRNMLKKVEVGNGLRTIDQYAFRDCYSLSSVSIPDSVTTIGEHAFGSCFALASVIIPNSVKSIDKFAFQYCYSLLNIVIPSSVTTMGNSVFNYCRTVSSVSLPDGVTSIPNNMFYECYSLQNFVIPNSVTTIGERSFYYCRSLTSVVIPSGVTNIANGAFNQCHAVKYYDFTKHTDVPTLADSGVFGSHGDDFEIRVPAALVDEWKAATNWSTYADYIVGV